jgi:hypothetical protein
MTCILTIHPQNFKIAKGMTFTLPVQSQNQIVCIPSESKCDFDGAEGNEGYDDQNCQSKEGSQWKRLVRSVLVDSDWQGKEEFSLFLARPVLIGRQVQSSS